MGATSVGERSVAAARVDRRAFAGHDGRRSTGAAPVGRRHRPDRDRGAGASSGARDLPAPAPQPAAHFTADPAFVAPQPPELNSEPQPPDLSTSAHVVDPPRLATGPNAFQRLRDAVAVRFALRRGGGAEYDSGVEIVSGAGAPKWNQRTHTREWSDTPPVVAPEATSPVMTPTQATVVTPELPVARRRPPGSVAPAPVVEPPAIPAPVKHGRPSRSLGFVADEPSPSEVHSDDDAPAADAAVPAS